ncbi:MAG: penicillin-binding transpeptidase domain-containing protein [Candidatus Omnitrophota bacterium]
MYNKSHKIRLIGISVLFTVLLSLILCRLYFIQVISSHTYQRIADSQQKISIILPSFRGAIYDCKFHKLAETLNVDSLYAAACQVTDKQKIAQILSEVFEKKQTFYFEKLSRDKMFVWLERKMSGDKTELIKRLCLTGLGLIKEGKRFYPNKSLAAHIIGFSGIDNNGLEGLELYYDEYLCGKPGRRSVLGDARRRFLPAYEYEYRMPKNGYNLVLTIDQVIQYIAEEALKSSFEKYKAAAANIIVMDPYNGTILAMANFPTFDLNNFSEANREFYRNRTVCDIFEPGSVFKIVTASAALEEKLVTLDDKFYCEKGEYSIGGRILHDHRPHGWLTFTDVIKKSSNIGTVKVAERLGEKKLYDYIKLFGFGEITGIELPGEVPGIVRSSTTWSKTSISAIPMGQEVAVTALQLSAAVAVIANGGILVKPRIVECIVDDNNELIKKFETKIKKRVLSTDTAIKMKDILKKVVEEGTGRAAFMDSYTACGKTGTAQKIEPNGSYSHSRFVASFVGFAPYDNPRIVIVVSVDEPKPVYYGGVVAAPVFREVAEKTLKYLNVAEDTVRLSPSGN